MMILGSALILALSIVAVAEPETRFIATNAPEESTLSLHRLSGAEKEGHAIFSTLTREGAELTLTPVYPLSPGETYEARVTLHGEVTGSLVYRHPSPDTKPPRVVRILPDTGKVPANLLKFYLEFDQPMREGGEFFDQVHLVDLEGREVESPWRREELWSDDNKRLTLRIHPGRIKLGVNLRQQLGPVLLPGQKYELILDKTIQSPAGKTLGKAVRHAFEATEENRTLLDVSTWKITAPKSTSEELIIETGRALDPYLAVRYLRIYQKEQLINGKIEWDSSQARFKFIPEKAWLPGDYRIDVGDFLEDLAGNTPLRAFDTDLSSAPPEKPLLRRDFTVR